MKKLLKLILFFIFGSYFCQDVQGFVSNENLIGIKDVVISLNNKTITYTNNNGYFSIPKAKELDTISFNKSGHLRKDILMKDFKESNHKITLERVYDIETVVFNEKEYKKVNYNFALKKQSNIRFIPYPNWEMGLKFKNDLEKKGFVSNVTLYLHKTDTDVRNTNVEINFYTIDSLTGKPKMKLNKSKIIYTPSDKSRKQAIVNVEKLKIPFPLNGIFVSMKWLPNEFNDKKLGPSIRYTTSSEEELTYERLYGDWGSKAGQNPRKSSFVNMMMGLEVYIKKTKNE
ncbi:hypothetical protein OF897_17795 [Chryseobacterium formosus]|uniref:Carboxypeptidase-like regulatory domain-containing protein n=1 Tax=Chryseobacterium formosus TaxID=1537363 RepID=A0ABT3XVX0_9FLAO|nr:hypothetical protein [Chryseobacterium formosus]MCX8525771.1 hypothetical protein [Chryseobacterium formosus]